MDILSNCLMNIYTYIHRLMLLWVLVREAPGCSGLLLIQKLLSGQNAENQWLYILNPKGNVHITVSKTQEESGRGGRRTTKARVLSDIILWTRHGCCIHEFTTEVAICTGQAPSNQYFSMIAEGLTLASLLPDGLEAINDSRERESHIPE